MVYARLFLFGLILSSTSYGGQGEALLFESVSLEAGLSQSSVLSILQGSRGFLWLGTRDGLNRYDGSEVTIYRHTPASPHGLSHNVVTALHEDRRGDLWIGTEEGGLNRLDRTTGEIIRPAADLSARRLQTKAITTFFADTTAPDVLWVGSPDGLTRLELGLTEAQSMDRGPALLQKIGEVRAIHRNTPGDLLWVGTDEGLVVLDPSGERMIERLLASDDARGLSSNRISALRVDRRGNIWIGTADRGLDRLNPATGEVTHFPEIGGHRVNAIHEDTNERLWIGTYGGGLHCLSSDRSTLVTHLHQAADPRSLSADLVMALAEDASGLLWIGTEGGGVNKLHATAFRTFGPELEAIPGVNNRSIRSFYEDPQGDLWVATAGSGLAVYSPDANGELRLARIERQRPEAPSSLSHNNIRTVRATRDGILWIGTLGGGLNAFDARDGRFTVYRHRPEDPASLASDDVRAVLEDRAGRLWIGTFDAGLDSFDRQRGIFIHHPGSSAGPLGSSTVRALFEDQGGTLWVGSREGLYRRVEGDETVQDTGAPGALSGESFVAYVHDPSDASTLSHDHVATVHESALGEIWVGTYGGGLNRLLDRERGVFARYDESDGLPNNVVYGILEDDRGHLWLSTNRGIARFAPWSGAVVTFDTGDGLLSDELNGNAYLRLRSGELAFGGIRGFHIFDPTQVGINQHAPPVVLTSFEHPGAAPRADLIDGAVLEIEPGVSSLSFEYAALDFQNPRKNRYSYQLEGFDPDWVAAGSRRYAAYTNLRPGSYTFRVRGSNNHGVWNLEGTSVRILLRAPFWRTRTFRIGSTLTLLGLLLGGYRLRTLATRRRHEALSISNTRLADEIAQRRELEVRLRETIDQLEDTNREIEARRSELERFLYTVSHDLKSPLFTIHGFLGLLEQHATSGDREALGRDVDRIRTAATKMGHLLDELLELSRIGRVVEAPENVSLDEVAHEALETVKGNHEEAGTVEIEIASAMPTVHGERRRLVEVFQNLLDNALRYMDGQPEPRIAVEAHTEDGMAIVAVRDNGRGIDPRYHERVFQLFETLSATSSSTGIGLAIVRRIVELHGGKIWVESEGLGQGATFRFTMPTAS